MNSTQIYPITRWYGQHAATTQDTLAVECPVALEFNGISHAVMLATPCELEYFALGFALTEGIIDRVEAFYGAKVLHSELGVTVQCDIAARAFWGLKQRRRMLMGRSGCGLCGVDSLSQLTMPLPVLSNTLSTTAVAILYALKNIAQFQRLNQLTGALHAAAWCNAAGEIQQISEDVGRHNALDKLIGQHIRSGFDSGFLLMTSRASVEIVQKAARVGIACLVAVSAPTSLAVQTAQEVGMTLIAFARDDHFVVYTHGDKII